MDYSEFVSNQKSMLIAPAGYGKTHTISTCLAHTTGKQLILTHTHAGIAALKEKIIRANIPSKSYHIETITSYAQKYLHAFYTGSDVPDQKNSSDYYPFVISKTTELLKLKPISQIVESTYSGLFVDEYQDCNLLQHELIKVLSNILPTRILGDHLQGIFKFNGGSLVDLHSTEHMGEFLSNKYELDVPRRWEGINAGLGDNLKSIRANLETNAIIDLDLYKSIEVFLVEENDIYDNNKSYNKKIRELIRANNVLIIHPETTSINPRKKLISTFNNSFFLVEAIDDKDFYSISEKIDTISPENIEQIIRDICYEFFNKTTLGNWFNESNLKNKTKSNDKEIITPIKLDIANFKLNPSWNLIAIILKGISKLPEMKCYRRELFRTVTNALENAHNNKLTVYENVKTLRNVTRRLGRKIDGKCIGTTLLTKGLEFDTVIILNAHRFKCPKNFYVALTRAKRKLIVFTNRKTLSPYET